MPLTESRRISLGLCRESARPGLCLRHRSEHAEVRLTDLPLGRGIEDEHLSSSPTLSPAILAGRRWKVITPDEKLNEILVAPSRGGRMPHFAGAGGTDIHPRVRQRMREGPDNPFDCFPSAGWRELYPAKS